jgi:predicted ATP-dependent endonuclease of OLD family
MKYVAFTISKYKAIESDLNVKLDNHRLLPIIGINECGKTTILHGIFAFDYYNDTFNQTIRHLDDVKNLYKTGQKENPRITAEVQIEWSDFLDILGTDDIKTHSSVNSYKRKKSSYVNKVKITRNLIGERKYTIDSTLFTDEELNDKIARQVIRRLPFILFFDDFRDSFPDNIEIKAEEKNNPQSWVAIIERLFQKTDENFSIFSLDSIEERERNSIISKVQKGLNETLTKEWQRFNLGSKESLKISISFTPQSTDVTSGAKNNPKLKFDVLETDKDGNEHFFFIRDRSKGFFWFFNFVMKLEFNPKVVSNDGVDAIYLLDEPGSYLHASAQSKLCEKIKDLSKDNYVVYCTHSHYLLDPDVIPISSIKIAEKTKDFSINLKSIYDSNKSKIKRNAFQPLYDALQLKPFKLDINDHAVIVEGIYDFYCFNMFIEEDIKYVPSLGADSIIYYISLMIGWGIEFKAIWDNDEEGISSHKKALKYFGNDYKNNLLLLPKGNKTKVIIQDFIDGDEIKHIKTHLELPQNTSFEKVIATLYYSEGKDNLISRMDKTKAKFQEVGSLIKFI